MSEVLDVLRLFGGFVYLVLGGDLLVRGALGLSQRTSIAPIIIGLTVVAFGTSAPELVISVYATATGYTGVAIGNVVGSNIANVLLVIGAPALIHAVATDTKTLGRQSIFMLLITLVFIAMIFDGELSRIEGTLLVVTLIAALYYVYHSGVSLPGSDTDDEAHQFERVLGLPHLVSSSVLFIGLGVILLPLGADLTVDGATAIARRLDVSDVVIGSTVIALGTSLPELTTTVIAAFHRSSDIAIGNVIGSNVFNILLVGGVSAMVAPLPAPAEFRAFDVWVMLGATLVMVAFVGMRQPIGRLAGVLFVAGYVGYIFAVI